MIMMFLLISMPVLTMMLESKHNASESSRTRRCQGARLNIRNSCHCSHILPVDTSKPWVANTLGVGTLTKRYLYLIYIFPPTIFTIAMILIMITSLSVNFLPKWNLASSLSILARASRSSSSMAACTGNRFDSMNCGCSPDIVGQDSRLSLLGFLEYWETNLYEDFLLSSTYKYWDPNS